MEEICIELDKTKAALEKLQADYQLKADLSESLRKARNDHLIKIHESKIEIEKHARELDTKTQEISLLKQMYEDLKSSLQEKESLLEHLSSAQDQFRSSCDEKVQKLERENIELLSVLDETNVKREDQEKKICAYMEEIEGLKRILSVSQRKCVDAEQRAKAHQEVRQRDDLLEKIEVEKRRLEEQLKWKNEHFLHLKEAHEKLQDQFHVAKKEWESEKSTLLEEICSLQANLESQTRALLSVQSQLKMCNQALAHEESRRKLLEVQLAESKTCFENVVAEYEGANCTIESLTGKREEEIAFMRNSLATKEILFREMKYNQTQLEQENQDLKESLKELQEAQIRQVSSTSSVSKLRQKLRGLEQVHRDCSVVLKAKESECNCRIETIENELNKSRLELCSRDERIKQLQTELEDSYSSLEQLKLQNEEISVMLMVFRSEFLQPLSEVPNSKPEMELCGSKWEEQIALLKKQLNQKDNDLTKAEAETEHQLELTASLAERLEASEQHNLLLQKELQRYKEMLEESSKCQDEIKEKASNKELSLSDDMREVCSALDKASSDLAERKIKESQMVLELHQWKLVAEQLQDLKVKAEAELKTCWEENEKIRREIDAAILSKVEVERELMQEKANYHLILDAKDKCLDDLQRSQEEESIRREMEAAIFAATKIEQTFRNEKHGLMQTIEQKDAKMNVLHKRIHALEEQFTRSVSAAVSLGLAEKESEVSTLCTNLEKIAMATILSEVEMNYRGGMIFEMEREIEALKQCLEMEKKSQNQLKIKLLKKERIVEQLMGELEISKDYIEEIKAKIKEANEINVRLSCGKYEILEEVMGFSDKIREFLGTDAALIASLKSIALV